MSSSINGNPSVNAPLSGLLWGNKSSNPTDSKVSEVAGKAVQPLHQPNGFDREVSLSKRAELVPVGRTWPQFGRLVASYITLGFISVPTPRVSSAELLPVSSIPESVGPLVEVGEKAPSNPAPARTVIGRALDAIKSLFTSIFNWMFGARAA